MEASAGRSAKLARQASAALYDLAKALTTSQDASGAAATLLTHLSTPWEESLQETVGEALLAHGVAPLVELAKSNPAMLDIVAKLLIATFEMASHRLRNPEASSWKPSYRPLIPTLI